MSIFIIESFVKIEDKCSWSEWIDLEFSATTGGECRVTCFVNDWNDVLELAQFLIEIFWEFPTIINDVAINEPDVAKDKGKEEHFKKWLT